MEAKDLSSYIDFVFKIAMKKCGSTNDARDLSQDVMLCALIALKKGNVVEKPEQWLSAIVNNCFNRTLRYKYKYQTSSLDKVDIADDKNGFDDIFKDSLLENIRRETAYLSKTYRDVFVKFYMQGKSVLDISKELNIPKGTVLSRLDTGRKHIKKEVYKMQNYGDASFSPGNLILLTTGHSGRRGEPFSLADSLLAKNVLLVSYEKPVNEKEIAGTLGISLPYIEETVDNLVGGELMKRKGAKVYTNFAIYTVEDSLKALDEIKKVAAKSFDTAWPVFVKCADKISGMKCFDKFNPVQKMLLAMYDMTHCAVSRLCLNEIDDQFIYFDDFPERPDGGKWYATGLTYPDGYKERYPEISRYSLYGELNTKITNYDGHDYIMTVDFDTFIGKTHTYYQNLKYKIEQSDAAEILYNLKYDKPIEEWQMALIPEFEKIGLVAVENGMTHVLIPFITYGESKEFDKITSEGVEELTQALAGFITDYFNQPKAKYPKDLDLPVQFRMTDFTGYLPMAYVYAAVQRGKLNLDDNQNYPVMYMIIK